MNREEKIAESLIAAGQVFDMATVDDWVNKLRSGIKAPVVGVKYSTLGGEKDVSILIMVSMDDKKDWINNILENSHYVRLHLYNDGVLDMISGHVKPAKNFRKTRVKSVEDAIVKINRYVVEVDRARAEVKTGRTGTRNEAVAAELAKIAAGLVDSEFAKDMKRMGFGFDGKEYERRNRDVAYDDDSSDDERNDDYYDRHTDNFNRWAKPIIKDVEELAKKHGLKVDIDKSAEYGMITVSVIANKSSGKAMRNKAASELVKIAESLMV